MSQPHRVRQHQEDRLTDVGADHRSSSAEEFRQPAVERSADPVQQVEPDGAGDDSRDSQVHRLAEGIDEGDAEQRGADEKAVLDADPFGLRGPPHDPRPDLPHRRRVNREFPCR